MEEQRARKKQGKVSATEDDSAGYDLLSSLPEPLIHHVLSFLPLKDIVKASAVCKSWGRIFSSFPVLDFQSREFLGKGSVQDGVGRMARFVDATMTRFQEQHLKIDKFAINYPCFYEWPADCLSQIDKWTAIALDSNANEISIDLPCWSYSSLRDTVPQAPSLNLVALSSSTNLKSLRSLTLDGFRDAEFLSWGRLMSACGSLESLSITRCCLEEVRISGLPNLKTVSITCNRLVELNAPSLESFSVFSRGRTHPCVVNVNHSPNLKSLTLNSVAENDDWFRDFLSGFQRLQCLSIKFCSSLSRIRISNPLVEDIKIIGCNHLTDISIAAPELRRFRLETLNGLLPSIRMKDPSRRNPVGKVDVYFPLFEEPKPGWSHELREFLAGSCKSFSSLSFRAHALDYELKLRNDIKPRWLGVIACNFQQLSLAQRRATQEPLPRAVDVTNVNGLIWTHHPTTMTAVVGLSEDDFLQLFFDKVAGRHRCLRKDCTSYMDGPGIKIHTGSNK